MSQEKDEKNDSELFARSITNKSGKGEQLNNNEIDPENQ
jgi:hypothetical protein